MITYQMTLENITVDTLRGFFVGWPNPPSPETHLKMLANSSAFVVAIDDQTHQVVGFINALSDGVLNVFIPNLEVLPEYQKQGIGSELVARILEHFSDLYAVDLVCDEDVQPFYQRLGMMPVTGMAMRRYARQAGVPAQETTEGTS